MSLMQKIYEAIRKEYEEHQKEREENLKGKNLGITDITAPCEEKAILKAMGTPVPFKYEEIGARLHGTFLHQSIEQLLQKHYSDELEMEQEYAVMLKGWRLIGHPDAILKSPENTEVYDFKFVHPFAIEKLIKSGKPPVQYTWQLNLYQYLLRKNKVPVRTGYLEMFNKIKGNFKDRETNEKMEIDEFSIREVEVPYDERVVRVMLNHAMDIIKKVENGEVGLGVKETVEKLKRYYMAVGLDPADIEKEGFERWACRYCDYKDICPILQAQKKMENQKQNQKNKGKEVSL